MAVNEQEVYARVSRRTGFAAAAVQRIVEMYGDEWVRADKADRLATTPKTPRKRTTVKAKAQTAPANSEAAQGSTEAQ